jgi:hypothetical protein
LRLKATAAKNKLRNSIKFLPKLGSFGSDGGGDNGGGGEDGGGESLADLIGNSGSSSSLASK